MTTIDPADSPGVPADRPAELVPDWYGPAVEAVLAEFRATGEKEDPSWRSLARRCVIAVWDAATSPDNRRDHR